MSKLTYMLVGPSGPISTHKKPEVAVAKFWKSDATRISVFGFGGLYKGRLMPHSPDTVSATFIDRNEEGGAV
jgi:hypothetical protein